MLLSGELMTMSTESPLEILTPFLRTREPMAYVSPTEVYAK
jgi:hypothetical protein